MADIIALKMRASSVLRESDLPAELVSSAANALFAGESGADLACMIVAFKGHETLSAAIFEFVHNQQGESLQSSYT